MISVGIIGCGYASERHMEAYHRIDKANVIAVLDTDSKAVEAFSRKFDIPKTFTDYSEFIENSDIDLVDICTPTSTHKEIVLDTAKHVSNILLEKPMARTSEECDEIISVCKENDVNICICHNKRFVPSIVKAKSTLENNNDNEIVIRATFTKFRPPIHHWTEKPEEGGMLWEEGTHLAYLLQYLLGDIKKVRAVGSKSVFLVYDNIKAFLRSSKDSLGLMDISWTSENSDQSLDIFSLQHTSIKVDLEYRQPIILCVRSSGAFVKKTLKEFPKHLISGLLSKFVFKDSDKINSHHFELIDKYIESILKDEKSPVPPEEGRNAIHLLECIEKSIKEKKVIECV